jgi:ABC-type phosphate transport system substrate-binding protein
MKWMDGNWRLAVAVGLLCAGLYQTFTAVAQGSDALVMVANKSNTAASGMSVGDVKKLLLGEVTDWRSGAKVLIVLTRAGTTERATVLKKVCGMTETVYTRYMMQSAFTGATIAKVSDVPSAAAIKDFVKANPGAIGFLPKSMVDDSVTTVLVLN